MKKIIKNILLTFVILFTVLNLSLYVFSNIYRRTFLNDTVVPILNGEVSGNEDEMFKEEAEKYKVIYGEEVPGLTLLGLNWYIMGSGEILELQTRALIVATILSIIIGILISLEEKSKVKLILKFILIGLLIFLSIAIYNTIYYKFFTIHDYNFFEGIIELVYEYGIYYLIGFFIIYMIKFYISKRKAKMLNQELKNKKR